MRFAPRAPVALLAALSLAASFGCDAQATGGAILGTGGAQTSGHGGSTAAAGGSTAAGGIGGPLRLFAAADDTCVVSGAGHVACWGSAETGQLALGDFTDRWTPTWIPALDGVADLAVGDFAMCARKTDDSVWCWGMNDYGELAATTADCPALGYPCSAVPVLASPQGAGALVPGEHEFCQVEDLGGGVPCWGMGPSVDAAGYQPLSAAVGESHACIRFAALTGQDPTRNVVCSGSDASGQLGQGSAGASGPIASGIAGGFVELAAGMDFTCAVGAGGALFCWGDNQFGELGVGFEDSADFPESCSGTGACSQRPVPVVGLPPVAHVAARYEQACALTTAGEVYCWGTPSQTSPASADACWSMNLSCTPTPQIVAGVEGATAIAVGYGHACALTGASQVTCWGLDTHGQLGRGTGGPAWDATPVAVQIPPEPM
jgi:hypothetical protein